MEFSVEFSLMTANLGHHQLDVKRTSSKDFGLILASHRLNSSGKKIQIFLNQKNCKLKPNSIRFWIKRTKNRLQVKQVVITAFSLDLDEKIKTMESPPIFFV